jgi:peptidoglycan hydrolase-like protein with peptidoglycan-binding domain
MSSSRIFFQKAQPGHVSPSGTLVTDLQLSLNASGAGQLDTDGLFGKQTQLALHAYQVSRGLTDTGSVTAETWASLMGSAEPSIFQRCLQVTASFEGTHFTEVVGNFDGAGVTWGIIGFTLINGEIGEVLAAAQQRYPDLVVKAFGDDAAQIMTIAGPATSRADKTAWADSVSRGPKKYGVAEPWKTYFYDFGSFREVQKLQIDRAHDAYWAGAIKDANALGMGEELDLMLFYDIRVQNGGMGSKGRMASAKAAFAQQAPKTARRRREIVAQVVADTIGTYKQDVLDRKTAIATGAGKVHGGQYATADWGLIDGASTLVID